MKFLKLRWLIALMLLSLMTIGGCSKDSVETNTAANIKKESPSSGVVEVSYDELMKLIKKGDPVFVMMVHNRELKNTNVQQIYDYDAKKLGKKVYLFSWENAPEDLIWNPLETSKTRDELESISITEPKSIYLGFKNGEIIKGSSTGFSGNTRPFEEGEFSNSIQKTLGK
ncbi:hypothetical protein ACWKTX_20135 [Bacillus thuringiensis]